MLVSQHASTYIHGVYPLEVGDKVTLQGFPNIQSGGTFNCIGNTIGNHNNKSIGR